jgi:alpha-1,6-mannosyltransferase
MGLPWPVWSSAISTSLGINNTSGPGGDTRQVSATSAAPILAGGRLVVCDVALFYAERSGGIRTYLDEKANFAQHSGAFEHHLVIPGKRERHEGGRHLLRSLQLAASNGYRIPLGARALKETLRAIRPHVVILHDPFWRPLSVTREAHRLGAAVVDVHHASPALNAAGIPGPDAVYLPTLRRIYQHAYEHVDAVMSMIDTAADSGRSASLQLGLGLHPAFRPGPAARGEHLLYVGRLSLEKRVCDLLDAIAGARRRRRLVLVGDGPARTAIEARARRLGIAGLVEFRPFVSDRRVLARLYREAACVVAPGPHETFGLAVLEAAASGARVVACSSTPAARVAAPIVHTFTPKDPVDLRRAIDLALRTPVDATAAAALAESMSWRRVFETELRHLQRLCR